MINMNNLTVKKWIEPYRLLETVKLYCEMTDYTFDGSNKLIQKDKLYKTIEEKGGFGLYMKNVNKYYFFKPQNDFSLINKLIEVFGFVEDDYEYSQDSEYCLNLIDLGKAEATFLNI